MSSLNRTRVDRFYIENSITLDELSSIVNSENPIDIGLYTIENIFEKYDSVILNKRNIEQLLNGVKLNYVHNDTIIRIYDENNSFIGLGTIQNNILKRDVIL